MSTYTQHKGLEKPLSTEKYNVAVANKNSDVIDSELHKLDLKNQSQDELFATKEALNAEITRATSAEDNISDNLTNEINRATASETGLSNSLSAHISDKTNPHNVSKSQIGLGNVENKSSATIRSEITKSNVTNALGYTPYTPNEVDNKLSALETNIDWKESVATFDDIGTTYPDPQDGWTVNVNDTDYTYRYNGTSWIPISANAIPKATDSVDGLLSMEDHAKYEDANSKKHAHSNKSVLDGITSADMNKLSGIEDGAEVNVQSDWDETDSESDAFIKNKPTSLPASDVSAWAKADKKPSYTKDEIGLGNVPNVATNDQTPTFEMAEERTVIIPGEKLSIIFGKIIKWLSDLKKVAFSGSYNDLSDKPISGGKIMGAFTVYADGSSPDPDLKVRDGRVDILKTDGGNSVAKITKNDTVLETGRFRVNPLPNNAKSTDPILDVGDNMLISNRATKINSRLEINGNVYIPGNDTYIYSNGKKTCLISPNSSSVDVPKVFIGTDNDNIIMGTGSAKSEPPTGIWIQGDSERMHVFGNNLKIGQKTSGSHSMIEIEGFATDTDGYSYKGMIKLRGSSDTNITVQPNSIDMFGGVRFIEPEDPWLGSKTLQKLLLELHNGSDSSGNYLPITGGTIEVDNSYVSDNGSAVDDITKNKISSEHIYLFSKVGLAPASEHECKLTSERLMFYGNDYIGNKTEFSYGGVNVDDTVLRLRVYNNSKYNYIYIDELSMYSWANNYTDLGKSSVKWKNIYAANGTIQTSDRNEKHDIAQLQDDLTKSFVMGLLPSSYKMNAGTSGRTHWGFISQDIEELMNSLGMDSKDFGGFIKSPKTIMVEEDEEYETIDENGETIIKTRKVQKEQVVDGEYIYSLRYDEFIAPIIKVEQGHENRLNEQDERIEVLENIVQSQQAEINELKQAFNELKEMIKNGN